MGAAITNDATGYRLKLSNGAHSALHEVLALAAGRLAKAPWQAYWAHWLGFHDLSSYGHGLSDWGRRP